MADILFEKARQAQICLEVLKQELHMEIPATVAFCVNRRDRALLHAACVMRSPFSGRYRAELGKIRRANVKAILHKESVLQTAPAAAVMALDAMLAQEIGLTRNAFCERKEILCNVAIAGLHMSRLYMCTNIGNEAFGKVRNLSARRMKDPLNGQYYRYRTKDRMWFAPAVFNEEQRERFLELIFEGSGKKIPKPGSRKAIGQAIGNWNSFELEKALEEACIGGYRIRTREEWENTSPGAQLKENPPVKLEKKRKSLGKSFGKMDMKHGPLSGIRVLDLTVGLAGPTCCRILAEQGAEVLMLRKEPLSSQEHAMLELDGWAGKKHMDLDFRDPANREKMLTLVRQADIIVTSYRQKVLEAAGLSEDRIHALNPSVIFARELLVADPEWKNRSGGASAAEDITGISMRKGTPQQPKHMNGLPVAYLSGMLLAAGIMQAIQLQMTEGGSFSVTGSLTGTAQWLHRCTDAWESMRIDERTGKQGGTITAPSSTICTDRKNDSWKRIYQKVAWTEVGDVFFLAPAACCGELNYPLRNMRFVEEKEGFSTSR